MTKAQAQRLWAAAAKERWKRHLAAVKGKETRRRKQLAQVERQIATATLAEVTTTVTDAVITREAEKVLAHVKQVVSEGAVTTADKIRHNAAISQAEKDIARLKVAEFYPAEEAEIKQKARAEVVLGRELVEQAVLDFYEKAKAEGRIERISRGRVPGTTSKVKYRERYGVIADRRDGRLLSESSLEDQVHSMMRAAEVVGKRQAGGKLYATFSYFEYGKNAPRSGYNIPVDPKASSIDFTSGTVQDEFGQFYQSFDATSYLGGAEDAAGLEVRLRAVLERKLKEGAGKNAAVLIGFQIKSYVERSEEERQEYDRAIWRKLKAAQRKAEKDKAKAKGETQWIDLEKVTEKE